MALLPEETLDTVFILKRRLLLLINESTKTQFLILEQFGETTESNVSLEELQNTREKLTTSYSRLNTLLLRITEYQPAAPTDMLDLLARTQEEGEAGADASSASIEEVKRYWSL